MINSAKKRIPKKPREREETLMESIGEKQEIQGIREMGEGSLQFSFKGGARQQIRKQVQMRRVWEKRGEKREQIFYGEMISFKGGLRLLVSRDMVAEMGYKRRGREEKEIEESIWMEKAREGVQIKGGLFYIGKEKVELQDPLRVQGDTSVLVRFEFER